MLLLPARIGKEKVHCNHMGKQFLKFSYEASFAVDADEGWLVHKYVHCSCAYALLFRDVRPTAKVSVEIVYSKTATDTNVIAGTYNGHRYEMEFSPGYQEKDVISTKYFSERMRMWLCANDLGITLQQKVNHKYIGLYKLIKLETPRG